MTITSVRYIIIFIIVVCYYQSWVSVMNCERNPYDPACRGVQIRKRSTPLIMCPINCKQIDCTNLLKIKLLITFFDDNPKDIYPAKPLPFYSKKLRAING